MRFSKWRFIVILQFFLLIIMAVWIIKQTIKKDYNIQSCQWMVCDRFCHPTQDHQCGLFTNVNYQFSTNVKNISLQLPAHFQQKWLLIHWLSIISWLVVKCTNVVNLVWRLQNEKNFAFALIFSSFGPSNKSGYGKSWQIVDFMFALEDFWFLDSLQSGHLHKAENLDTLYTIKDTSTHY